MAELTWPGVMASTMGPANLRLQEGDIVSMCITGIAYKLDTSGTPINVGAAKVETLVKQHGLQSAFEGEQPYYDLSNRAALENGSRNADVGSATLRMRYTHRLCNFLFANRPLKAEGQNAMWCRYDAPREKKAEVELRLEVTGERGQPPLSVELSAYECSKTGWQVDGDSAGSWCARAVDQINAQGCKGCLAMRLTTRNCVWKDHRRSRQDGARGPGKTSTCTSSSGQPRRRTKRPESTGHPASH